MLPSAPRPHKSWRRLKTRGAPKGSRSTRACLARNLPHPPSAHPPIFPDRCSPSTVGEAVSYKVGPWGALEGWLTESRKRSKRPRDSHYRPRARMTTVCVWCQSSRASDALQRLFDEYDGGETLLPSEMHMPRFPICRGARDRAPRHIPGATRVLGLCWRAQPTNRRSQPCENPPRAACSKAHEAGHGWLRLAQTQGNHASPQAVDISRLLRRPRQPCTDNRIGVVRPGGKKQRPGDRGEVGACRCPSIGPESAPHMLDFDQASLEDPSEEMLCVYPRVRPVSEGSSGMPRGAS